MAKEVRAALEAALFCCVKHTVSLLFGRGGKVQPRKH